MSQDSALYNPAPVTSSPGTPGDDNYILQMLLNSGNAAPYNYNGSFNRLPMFQPPPGLLRPPSSLNKTQDRLPTSNDFGPLSDEFTKLQGQIPQDLFPRVEQPIEPRQRARFWPWDDVLNVLKNGNHRRGE